MFFPYYKGNLPVRTHGANKVRTPNFITLRVIAINRRAPFQFFLRICKPKLACTVRRPRPRHAVFIVQAARHPQTAVACSPTVPPLHAHLRGVKIPPHGEFRPSRDRPAGPGARAFSISFSRRPRLTLPRRHPRSAAFPCTLLSHGARAASVFLESSDVVLFIFSSSVPTGSFL